MILEDLNHISYIIAVFCYETSNRSFVFPVGFFFFQNGRMLTSSGLDQRSAKFGGASNSSEWRYLLKFGRFKIATLMTHANFFAYFTFQRFFTSSL